MSPQEHETRTYTTYAIQKRKKYIEKTHESVTNINLIFVTYRRRWNFFLARECAQNFCSSIFRSPWSASSPDRRSDRPPQSVMKTTASSQITHLYCMSWIPTKSLEFFNAPYLDLGKLNIRMNFSPALLFIYEVRFFNASRRTFFYKWYSSISIILTWNASWTQKGNFLYLTLENEVCEKTSKYLELIVSPPLHQCRHAHAYI